MARYLSQVLKADAMRVMVSLSDLGSVRRTAEALNMTPSAVSKHIKRIEEGAGRKLFHRHHDGMRPNEEGIEFVRYAERFLELESELTERFGDDIVVGKVRLGITDDVGLARIPQLLKTSKIANPRLSIELMVDSTSALIEAVDERRLDLAILSDGGAEFPENASVLTADRLVWAKKPGMVLEREKVPLVLSTEGCRWRARAIDALDAAGIEFEVFCTSPSTAGQITAVQLGLGFAPVPRSVVQNLQGIGLDEDQLPQLGMSRLALYQTVQNRPGFKEVRDIIEQVL